MKLTYTSDSGAEYWTIAIWAEGSRLAGRERELKGSETYEALRMNWDFNIYTGVL